MRSLLQLQVLFLTAVLIPAAAGQTRHSSIPNDPLLIEQWYLFGPSDQRGSAGSINAIEAWKHIRPAPPIVVAVLDTGVNYSHPDLEANVWKNQDEVANGKDDDGNGYVDDFHGWDFALDSNDPRTRVSDDAVIPFDHGTAVAGLIAAVPNNGIGIAGVGRNVKIMPLRILGDNANLYSTFPRAVRYAIHNGAKVIVFTAMFDPSLSLLRDKKEAVEGPLREAEVARVLFVKSAGNFGMSIDDDTSFRLLAGLSNVLIVGGTDRSGNLSPRLNVGKLIGIAAPSQDMVFPSFDEFKRFKGPGTSFATPIVAGVAATLLSQQPDLTPRQVIQRLQDAAVGVPKMENVIGGGRLDMAKVFAP